MVDTIEMSGSVPPDGNGIGIRVIRELLLELGLVELVSAFVLIPEVDEVDDPEVDEPEVGEPEVYEARL
jgi:hypothetical protein